MPAPAAPAPAQIDRTKRYHDASILANRAEAVGFGFLLLGGILMLIGTILAIWCGGGVACLILGGTFFLAGLIENVHADLLHARAKLEQD